MITRRGFFFGSAAIVGASSLMPLYVPKLVLYGDGRDETDTLNAALRGVRTRWADGQPFTGHLRNGRFLVSGPIYVPPGMIMSGGDLNQDRKIGDYGFSDRPDVLAGVMMMRDSAAMHVHVRPPGTHLFGPFADSIVVSCGHELAANRTPVELRTELNLLGAQHEAMDLNEHWNLSGDPWIT